MQSKSRKIEKSTPWVPQSRPGEEHDFSAPEAREMRSIKKQIMILTCKNVPRKKTTEKVLATVSVEKYSGRHTQAVL